MADVPIQYDIAGIPYRGRGMLSLTAPRRLNIARSNGDSELYEALWQWMGRDGDPGDMSRSRTNLPTGSFASASQSRDINERAIIALGGVYAGYDSYVRPARVAAEAARMSAEKAAEFSSPRKRPAPSIPVIPGANAAKAAFIADGDPYQFRGEISLGRGRGPEVNKLKQITHQVFYSFSASADMDLLPIFNPVLGYSESERVGRELTIVGYEWRLKIYNSNIQGSVFETNPGIIAQTGTTGTVLPDVWAPGVFDSGGTSPGAWLPAPDPAIWPTGYTSNPGYVYQMIQPLPAVPRTVATYEDKFIRASDVRVVLVYDNEPFKSGGLPQAAKWSEICDLGPGDSACTGLYRIDNQPRFEFLEDITITPENNGMMIMSIQNPKVINRRMVFNEGNAGNSNDVQCGQLWFGLAAGEVVGTPFPATDYNVTGSFRTFFKDN